MAVTQDEYGNWFQQMPSTTDADEYGNVVPGGSIQVSGPQGLSPILAPDEYGQWRLPDGGIAPSSYLNSWESVGGDMSSQGWTDTGQYRQYGPGSTYWQYANGVTPGDPGWNDYVARAEALQRTMTQNAEKEMASGWNMNPLILAVLSAGMGAGAGFGGEALGGAAGEGFGTAGVLGDAATWGLGEAGTTAGAVTGGVDLGGGLWGGAADSLGGMPLTTTTLPTIPGAGQILTGGNTSGSVVGGVDPITGGNVLPVTPPAEVDLGGGLWGSAAGDSLGGMPLNGAGQTISPSLLSQLNSALGTNLTGTDVMRMLGSLGAAGIGAYASNQQTNALEDMAKRYEGYGAPYRQRLSDLYANPDSFLSSKEVQTPVQMGTTNLMRSLSTQGNPFGSGNALQQGQSYASDQLFSRLGQEKDRLAGFGGLSSYNQAAPQAATNAINSTSNAWNAAGSGVNNIFNPPQTPAQQAAEWMKVMGR